jgi:hypothetical protein
MRAPRRSILSFVPTSLGSIVSSLVLLAFVAQFPTFQPAHAANRSLCIADRAKKVVFEFPVHVTAYLSPKFTPVFSSALLYLQLEQTGNSPSVELQASESFEKCMRARARIRGFINSSWIPAGVFAVFLYFLMMLRIARRLPSSWKWFLSPILASLFVGSLVAYTENYQLTRSCGELDTWRLDTLGKVFLVDWVIIFVVFSAWAFVSYLRTTRRLRAIKSQ